jgi:hypothetical protein
METKDISLLPILSISGFKSKVEDALSELGNLTLLTQTSLNYKYFCISPSTKKLLLNYKIMVILYLISEDPKTRKEN